MRLELASTSKNAPTDHDGSVETGSVQTATVDLTDMVAFRRWRRACCAIVLLFTLPELLFGPMDALTHFEQEVEGLDREMSSSPLQLLPESQSGGDELPRASGQAVADSAPTNLDQAIEFMLRFLSISLVLSTLLLYTRTPYRAQIFVLFASLEAFTVIAASFYVISVVGSEISSVAAELDANFRPSPLMLAFDYQSPGQQVRGLFGKTVVYPLLEGVFWMCVLLVGAVAIARLVGIRGRNPIKIIGHKPTAVDLEKIAEGPRPRVLLMPKIRLSTRTSMYYALSLALFVIGICVTVVPPIGVIVACFILYLSARFWERAKRSAAMKAEEALMHDWRAPVVFLRSFEDDNLPIKLPFPQNLRPMYVFAGGDATFEEFITSHLRKLGPPVAISGTTKEDLPPLGASRLAADDRSWQEAVTELFDASRLIVVIVHDTPGLLWEVRELLKRRHLSKTVLIFPPLERDELVRRWNVFKNEIGILDSDEISFSSRETLPLGLIVNHKGIPVSVVGAASSGVYYGAMLRLVAQSCSRMRLRISAEDG